MEIFLNEYNIFLKQNKMQYDLVDKRQSRRRLFFRSLALYIILTYFFLILTIFFHFLNFN